MTETEKQPELEISVIPEESSKIFFPGFPIVRGRQMTPIKGIIYGHNGVGKSTFASRSKNPIFLDLEGNIDHLPIDKKPLKSFEEVEEFLKCLITQNHDYATVVIDSIDKLEAIARVYLEKMYKSDPKKLEYGRLYIYTSDLFASIMNKLDILRDQKRMNVVLIGHTAVKRCENPLYPTYDKYELRVHERVAAVVCDWAHFILFAVNDLSFEEEEDLGFNKTRGRVRTNDRRILYTTGNSAYVAKNVYDLPRTMPIDWNIFITAIKNFYAKPTQEGVN